LSLQLSFSIWMQLQGFDGSAALVQFISSHYQSGTG
jgi:hypothetical protein